ncbi:MAG TPA: ABC transporter ATP-binding protein [Oligoflexus sp.]|uniref:ABC transporter ATP-binding protein n=1 Tax=Oligoflexus sp. TaxID=1971216 RepID=UPI002D7624A2|nr:ABC transporter ATP-binding protein [Oligoflexus sp.]HYX33031.1 ABC transporter ATP-binding protein [Oligoflexus sp.]
MLTLEIASLSKTFAQSQFRLGPMNLQMHEGDSLALFGKNGAGKSTLFHLITGHLRPDEGRIQVFGETMKVDAFALKRRMGYLPQNLDLPRWVSGFDIITYAMKLHGMQPLAATRDRILEYWDCTSFAHKPLAACSYGMQKRIALALASMHKPDLLILDEPFSGLDLFHIRALENLLEERRGRQLTIVSTHVAAYAAKLSNRAATMREGQVAELQRWPEADFMARIRLMEEQFFVPGSEVRT